MSWLEHGKEKEIQEYQVLVSAQIHVLETKIREHLRVGWTAQGGLTYNSHDGLYCQALTRMIKIR